LAIVQAAQKRQELESKGDEFFFFLIFFSINKTSFFFNKKRLDTLIKKKQRELQQLEITLATIQNANNEYRGVIRGTSTAYNNETSFILFIYFFLKY
jgi:hypothetical protein